MGTLVRIAQYCSTTCITQSSCNADQLAFKFRLRLYLLKLAACHRVPARHFKFVCLAARVNTISCWICTYWRCCCYYYSYLRITISPAMKFSLLAQVQLSWGELAAKNAMKRLPIAGSSCILRAKHAAYCQDTQSGLSTSQKQSLLFKKFNSTSNNNN